jgi:ribosome-binding factor A
MAERRVEKVAHVVHAELAALLLTGVQDPRLRDVTVTAVRMTADLKLARVYVRALGAASPPDVVRALQRATPFLRREVGRRLPLRSVPELRFAWDDTPDTAERVDALLRGTHGTDPPSTRADERGPGRPASEPDDEDEA